MRNTIPKPEYKEVADTDTAAPPVETLRVQNFAGLTDVTLELSRLNILIGPQASGKSVCAKLVYYFRKVIWGLIFDVAVGDADLPTAIEIQEQAFLRFFPATNWAERDFRIDYQFGEISIYVVRNSNESTVRLDYSDYYREKVEDVQRYKEAYLIGLRRAQDYQDLFNLRVVQLSIETTLNMGRIYIPAGRSFYAILHSNIFTLLSGDTSVDPFLVEFGRFYEQKKREYASGNILQRFTNDDIKRIAAILQGGYLRESNRDYVVMDDGRKVSLEVSSSGQQEALPILLTLFLEFSPTRPSDTGRHEFAPHTLFVEEPEAHLFPAAQREMVHLMAAMGGFFDNFNKTQMVLTTHSPYLLATLNNLIYAGKLAKEKPDRMDEILKALDDTADVLIDPALVRVYWMENGTARPIVDRETGLIEATLLDEVSDDTSRTFSALLDVEFGEE